MEGNSDSNYKTIQRFLDKKDPRENLHSLFNEDSQIVIGDVTEISRPQAKKTAYVGKLGRDKKLGFWVLVLSFPYKGITIPFNFIIYSSKTINEEMTSRNFEHKRAIEELNELLGDRLLVLDREFSYEELFSDMKAEGVNFVIRLNLGNRPNIFDALEIYIKRMKIEESFRDLKSLLNVDKIMNKKQIHKEKIIALVLLAYCIGLLLGEIIRDIIYRGRKWRSYSGLFILLKQKIRLSKEATSEVMNNVYLLFMRIILGSVRTHI